MPELPEVEVSRQGLLPYLPGQRLIKAIFRTPKLREVVLPTLAERLSGLRVEKIERRGKYLLFDFESQRGGGWLILHLGMSGSLRLIAPDSPDASAQKHDHVDLVFAQTCLRFRDPRRFGVVLWHEGSAVEEHPRIAVLGIEPLSPEFSGAWLYRATRGRRQPIKTWLMDSHVITGIGNIYAAESLFLASISPLRPAGRLSKAHCQALAESVRTTLETAIAAGGSSVRDYVHSDGGAGSFQLSVNVYARQAQPCTVCGTPISLVRQAGRASFYCRRCQK